MADLGSASAADPTDLFSFAEDGVPSPSRGEDGPPGA
jgi:hypothetical protein